MFGFNNETDAARYAVGQEPVLVTSVVAQRSNGLISSASPERTRGRRRGG